MKIIADQGDAVVKFAESLPRFKEFENQLHDIDDLEQQSETLERTWVKCQRFIAVSEHVALAVNLPLVAPGGIQARYELLLAAEAGTLAPAR